MSQQEQNRSPFEDARPLYTIDSTGRVVTRGQLAQLFEHHREEPSTLLSLAVRSFARIEKIRNPEDKAKFVRSLIPNPQIQNVFTVMCRGEGVVIDEEALEVELNPDDLPREIQEHSDLIESLSPYLRQIDLARIVAIKTYREADESAKQTMVNGVYRMIGDYLGPRRHYKRESEDPVLLPLPDLPAELFSDDVIKGILFESEREAAVPIFNKRLEDGFAYLEQMKASLRERHPLQLQFVDELEAYFKKVSDFTVPGFKSRILGSMRDVGSAGRAEDESVYPSFHQREYAYRFISDEKRKKDLLIGDTGTMKTGAAIYAMEASGAKSTLVVCPPGVRSNWEAEINEKYEDNVGVVRIEGKGDLQKLRSLNGEKPRFVIIGYKLLSDINGEELEKLESLLFESVGIDSLVVDETHLGKEPSATCTQNLFELSKCLPDEAARIAMTATALVNSVEDLDSPIRILFPHKYQKRGDFTRAARNDPNLVSALLHGQHLMTRWTLEGILGDEAPHVEYKDELVPMSPFHQRLYEYVYEDDTIENQVKRGVLRRASLDPMIIRRYYHPDAIRGMIAELEVKETVTDNDETINEARIRALHERLQKVTSTYTDRDAALSDLQSAYDIYLRSGTSYPDLVFDEDFLARCGYEKLAIWAFFNLAGGADELARESDNPELAEQWTSKDGFYSSKYVKLMEILDELVPSGKHKVKIFSGFYQTDVTDGRETISPEDERAFYSLFDHLRRRYGDETVLKIDGTVSLSPKNGDTAEREQARVAWRLDPTKGILLSTLRSCRLGINLTIPETPENGDIENVTMIFLDYPDTWADLDQGVGRCRRKGQKLPINVRFLKGDHGSLPKKHRYKLIDNGMWETLQFKRLLSQMVLDGVPLTKDEERFVRGRLNLIKRVDIYPQNPAEHLTDLYQNTRGLGYSEVKQILGDVGYAGMTNREFFATHYSLFDERGLAGQNARVVTHIINRYKESTGKDLKVASVGSGAGILQITLGEKVFNIDMLEEILRLARARGELRKIPDGQYISGEGARLPIASEKFNVTDISFVLNWTSNKPEAQDNGQVLSERAKILQELNRITEKGGIVIAALPYSHLKNDQFLKWKEVLEEHFGFKVREDYPSGLVKGVDVRQDQISWVFTLEKVADINYGTPVEDETTGRIKYVNPPIVPIEKLGLDFEQNYRIIDTTRLPVDNGEREVRGNVAHHEFEIFNPATSRKEKIRYIQNAYGARDLVTLSERELDTRLFGTFGADAARMYKSLKSYGLKTMRLPSQEAAKLAFDTMHVGWPIYGGLQKHHTRRVKENMIILMKTFQEEA